MFAHFDALLAPFEVSTFFANHYEKRHLHLREGAERRHELLTTEEFFAALVQVSEMPENIVCFPEHMGTTRRELVSNAQLLRKYLDAGHPVVWNRARGISPRIDAISSLLARTFGGHVWPNVYATGTAGTPFDMHFDAHEVIAIQCAGKKTWDISEVRVDRPIEAVEMEPAIRRTLRARRDEATARILDSFTVSPGDMVYVPRGQFHNARTIEGRSLHVTFGIELLTGFDLAKRIVMNLLADPAMREYSLPATGMVEKARADEWDAAVAQVLVRCLSPDALRIARDELRQAWVDKSTRTEK